MNNSLMTKITPYGLTIMSDELKDKISKYILIGSNNYNDLNLIRALDDNDLNNNLSYEYLLNNRWVGYEDYLSNKYYDKNNFLTFNINLPYEIDLGLFVYGFGLIEITPNGKKLISVTRSPSIFNKVKNVTSNFSIKMTFGQEDLNSQFRDNVFDSKFVERKFLFIGSSIQDSYIISSQDPLSSINVGTKIISDNFPDNTVVVANSNTDTSIQINELKLSNRSIKNFNNEAIFVENVIINQDDYVTKSEIAKWQEEHNHNNLYYLIGERVSDSAALGGKSADSYISRIEFEKILDLLDGKLSTTGGYVSGSLLSDMKKSSNFRDEEFVPLFYIKVLLNELKKYIDIDFRKDINDYVLTNSGSLNLLSTKTRENIVSAINEVNNKIGTVERVNSNYSSVEEILNKIVEILGDIDNYNFNIKDKINYIDSEKPNKTNAIFTNAPIVSEELNINDPLQSDKRLIDIKNTKNLIKEIRNNIIIDLSEESLDEAFPVILNSNGINSYTDTRIWNEKSSKFNENVFLLNVYGNGSYNGMNAPELKVTHSIYKRGGNVNSYFVKRISMLSTSSSIIVYLRGGERYNLLLNGTDGDVLVCKDTLLIEGKITINKEAWVQNERLQQGYWHFIGYPSINLNYLIQPHYNNIYNP